MVQFALRKVFPVQGIIHTIDSDEEIIEFAKLYFERAGILNKVTIHHGDARTIIPVLEFRFQLIYIDGEKDEYPEYYKLAMSVLKMEGSLLQTMYSGTIRLFNRL